MEASDKDDNFTIILPSVGCGLKKKIEGNIRERDEFGLTNGWNGTQTKYIIKA